MTGTPTTTTTTTTTTTIDAGGPSRGAGPGVTEAPARIAATDGFQLAATLTVPPIGLPVRRAVVVAGATGVRRRYYGPFARFLAGLGCAVVTFDYRGIGDSAPPALQGFEARMREWGQADLAGVLAFARERWPAVPLGLVVHSVGGQVAGLAEGIEQVDVMVMVASQTGAMRFWPWWFRPYLVLLWYVFVPLTTACLGYFPARWFLLGESLPLGVAREWAAWARDREYLFGSRFGLPVDRYARLTPRLLAWTFSDDNIAPPRAGADLVERYSGARRTHHHLHPRRDGLGRVGHFGFFRERFRDTLWRETAGFLLA